MVILIKPRQQLTMLENFLKNVSIYYIFLTGIIIVLTETVGLYLPVGTGFMSLSPIFLELCLIMFGVLYIFLIICSHLLSEKCHKKGN